MKDKYISKSHFTALKCSIFTQQTDAKGMYSQGIFVFCFNQSEEEERRVDMAVREESPASKLVTDVPNDSKEARLVLLYS